MSPRTRGNLTLPHLRRFSYAGLYRSKTLRSNGKHHVGRETYTRRSQDNITHNADLAKELMGEHQVYKWP